MTDILDVLDMDEIEGRLRSGEFITSEQFYAAIEDRLGYDPTTGERKLIKRSMFPAERAILQALPQCLEGVPRREIKKTRPADPAPAPSRKSGPLTREDVLDIRADFREHGERWGWMSRTARHYGVRHNTISDIVHRKTWKDV